MHALQSRATTSLPALTAAIRAAWSPETVFASPAYMAAGRPGDRARGQCGATALVVQDRLGGELLVADVLTLDAGRLGVHYWNRLPSGEEVDLTREQFAPGAQLGPATVVERPPGRPKHGAAQYERLAAAVDRCLAADR